MVANNRRMSISGDSGIIALHITHLRYNTMINWHAIDTVLLDMDGTLLDLHFDNFFWLEYLPQSYAKEHQITLEQAHHKIGLLLNQYKGSLQWYCLDHWSQLTGLDIPTLKNEIKHKIAIRPFVIDFLNALKRHNKKIILITNAHRVGLDIKLEATKIDHWLDIIISSHDFQSPKEEPYFWQCLQKIEPFDLKSTVFIDDTPRILRRAQQFGIQHLICITQPDLQAQVNPSNEFIDIDHFDKIMPSTDGP